MKCVCKVVLIVLLAITAGTAYQRFLINGNSFFPCGPKLIRQLDRRSAGFAIK
jgi:hypothetical protein